MQASTVVTPTAGHFWHCFVAIELSERTWLVSCTARTGTGFRGINLKGAIGLLALIEQIRARAAKKTRSSAGDDELLRGRL